MRRDATPSPRRPRASTSRLFTRGVRSARLCALLAVAGVFACAAPTSAQDGTQEGVRVLERNTETGGPAGVALDELGPLFGQPELDAALRDLDRGRSAAAIELLTEWMAANPDSPLFDEATFALGYAYYVGAHWTEAISTLTDCPSVAPLFADYCMYFAADAALRSGDGTAAEAMAATVDEGSVYGPRARALRGRALAAAERHGEAVRAFEDFIADYPGAWYRTDIEFELAAEYEATGDFDEAARVYHRIALVNPDTREETRADDALEAIADQVSPRLREQLRDRTNAETLDRARVLFDRHRSEQVIDLLTPVTASETPGSTVFCEASYLVAKSYSKLRQHRDSIPGYLAVVEHCDDEELVVKSLYNGGRGAWNIDEDADAVARFEDLWTRFPHHSYADDAMLLAARVHRSNDDEEAYIGLLERQVRDFPDGDMLKDAVWLLVSRLYTAGDYRGVITFVDELGSRTGENDIYSRGRLGYFRARSLEHLSLNNEARGAYAEVARANPMAYYALLALNRMQDLDPSRAEWQVREFVAGTDAEDATIRVQPPEAATHPSFLRGRALLRMGLYDLAESEFDKLQAAYANEDEIGWVVSLMYHHAGAFERSHHVPGERLDLNLGYPNAANMERWEIAYPTPFLELVMEAAEDRDLDPYWVYAIMREESGFRPEIESWANARGLLQLMEGTANDMAQLTGRGSVRTSELFDPEVNIELGTMFMRTLADRFASHPCLIFAGYNGGHGNVNSWLRARGDLPLDLWVEEIPYAQTRHYVQRVTMTWWVYHWMNGDHLPDLRWDLEGI